MSAVTKNIPSASFTLAAATETELLGANGIDVNGCDRIHAQVVNTHGSNSIDTVTAYISKNGTNWDAYSTNFAGTGVVHGDSCTVILDDSFIGPCRLRITATSTSGASATILGDGGVSGR